MTSNSTGSSKWAFPSIAEQAAAFRVERSHCPICGDPATDIDHDHATGKVRGHICRGCNVGLGNFKDNPLILKAAATYLEEHARTGLPISADWSQSRAWVAGVARVLASMEPEEFLEKYGEDEALAFIGNAMQVVDAWDRADAVPVVFS